MGHGINKETFSTFLKGRGLSKRFSTAAVVKNFKHRLIYFPPTISSVQTPSKL